MRFEGGFEEEEEEEERKKERKKRKKKSKSQLRNCVKVEVDVLGFPSLIALTVSVDVKEH